MNVGFWEEKMGNMPHPSRHAIIINLCSGNKANPRLQPHVSTFRLVNVIFASEEVMADAVLSNFLLLDIGTNF